MAHSVQNCLKFLISWGNFKCLPDPKELQTLATPPSGCAFLCVSTHFLLDIFGPFIVLWSSVQTSFQMLPTQHRYSQQEEIINTQIWSSPGLILPLPRPQQSNPSAIESTIPFVLASCQNPRATAKLVPGFSTLLAPLRSLCTQEGVCCASEF